MKKKFLVILLCVLTLVPIALTQTSRFDSFSDYLFAPSTKWFRKLEPQVVYSTSVNADLEISYGDSTIGIGSIGVNVKPIGMSWVCEWSLSLCDGSEEKLISF
jgi:hypothetical protein